jgi:hypothetical protein
MLFMRQYVGIVYLNSVIKLYIRSSSHCLRIFRYKTLYKESTHYYYFLKFLNKTAYKRELIIVCLNSVMTHMRERSRILSVYLNSFIIF